MSKIDDESLFRLLNNNPINTHIFFRNLDTDTMNDLEKFFYLNNHRFTLKDITYFNIYDRHFKKYRDTDVVILEIGVYKGGSLQMWKDYFGPKCKVIGIDTNPNCKDFEEPQIEIMIGSQDDVNFLNTVKQKYPKIDIVIDDGGHYMNQQITAFKELYPHISENGIYLCEDICTSYWAFYGGGYKKPSTFIEYSKNTIDYLNACHSESPDLAVSDFSKSAYSIHYYNNIFVVEKGFSEDSIPIQSGS